ncbi:MAC/perforin domain-containing protein [Falsiroseomonas oryzae]|uniref:MAC/perforin domain-containing protein n=1 Tax=Falsiroseomonas oryzae TaxID=2766473 RepID=UPI0022EA9538|nr:MAC/perforin domain-containing protein [Roseomonas sp. MO-31]
MSSDEIISGVSFLGRGVDLLELDPFNVAGSCKLANLILTTKDETYEKEGHTIPSGLEVFFSPSTTVEGGERMMSNSYDFQKEFSESITANAGVDGLFEFSASSTVKTTAQQSASRKEVFTFLTVNHTVCIATLDLDGVQASNLQLNKNFIAAVKALPTKADRAAYRAFIKTFGTHYLHTVTLGGMAYSKISTASASQSDTLATSETFKSDARFTGCESKLGVERESQIAEQKKNDAKSKVHRSLIQYVGGIGNPEAVDKGWVESVEKKPVPIIGTRKNPGNFEMRRVSTLLVSALLKDEEAADLAAKRRLLDDETSSYITERGGDEGGRIRYGHPIRLEAAANNFRLFYCPDRKNGPHLYDRDPQNSPETGATGAVAREAIMIVHGQGRAVGEDVYSGDPVTLQIMDPKTFFTWDIVQITGAGNPNAGQLTGRAAFHPEARRADGEYTIRVRGSGQPLEGSEAQEKRRPLVSGDVIMLARHDKQVGAFLYLSTAGLGELGCNVRRVFEDPLFSAVARSDSAFLVIRNAKTPA